MGFYADNGGEFLNIKMDELIAKLGITVRYGLAYSPWLIGINERNHASCDVTIRKLMEEKKVVLTDSLVKAAVWTHNTNIDKLGYTPLQLVTGKSFAGFNYGESSNRKFVGYGGSVEGN